MVRWISELELYAPEIVYKPGQENIVADILSRMNFESPSVPPASQPMEPEYIFATWDKLPPTLRSDWPLLLIPSNREQVKSLLDKEEKNFIITSNRVFR